MDQWSPYILTKLCQQLDLSRAKTHSLLEMKTTATKDPRGDSAVSAPSVGTGRVFWLQKKK